MSFIDQKCTFDVLSEDVLSECLPFTCGEDEDMDEFFSKDALTYARRRIGKSYCFRLEEDEKQIVACFTLSNDSIRIWDLGSSKKNAMWKELTNREKMLSRFPGVLIGRLAVSESFAGKGIGRYLTLSKCGSSVKKIKRVADWLSLTLRTSLRY